MTHFLLRRMMLVFSLWVFQWLPTTAFALSVTPDSVFVRIIDTGPGLAAVIVLPGHRYMIYDTGHWNAEDLVMDRVSELIPAGAEIELLVQSHSDADHLSSTELILENYRVKRVLRTGLERQTTNWKDAHAKIRKQAGEQRLIDINLKEVEYPMGSTYRFGEVLVTMVIGHHSPPAEWGLVGKSEKRNGGSIVIRLYYAGKSILLTGDAVGRHIGAPVDQLIGTEREMVNNADVIPIDSDVLIAPHHGADNGSSTRFIEAVSPQWVIFSAGHQHHHPHQDAVQRYIDFGVSEENMLRTDLGDDEGGHEWSQGRIPGFTDRAGDDDIDILILKSGDIKVDYRKN